LGAIERLAFLTVVFIQLFASPRLLFPALCLIPQALSFRAQRGISL
jgi:hypothetical protein